MPPGAPGAPAGQAAQPGTTGSTGTGRTGWRWLLRVAAAVRHHWLVSALLAAGLVLRVLALVAYHPALIYVDTLKYLLRRVARLRTARVHGAAAAHAAGRRPGDGRA